MRSGSLVLSSNRNPPRPLPRLPLHQDPHHPMDRCVRRSTASLSALESAPPSTSAREGASFPRWTPSIAPAPTPWTTHHSIRTPPPSRLPPSSPSRNRQPESLSSPRNLPAPSRFLLPSPPPPARPRSTRPTEFHQHVMQGHLRLRSGCGQCSLPPNPRRRACQQCRKRRRRMGSKSVISEECIEILQSFPKARDAAGSRLRRVRRVCEV